MFPQITFFILRSCLHGPAMTKRGRKHTLNGKKSSQLTLEIDSESSNIICVVCDSKFNLKYFNKIKREKRKQSNDII